MTKEIPCLNLPRKSKESRKEGQGQCQINCFRESVWKGHFRQKNRKRSRLAFLSCFFCWGGGGLNAGKQGKDKVRLLSCNNLLSERRSTMSVANSGQLPWVVSMTAFKNTTALTHLFSRARKRDSPFFPVGRPRPELSPKPSPCKLTFVY